PPYVMPQKRQRPVREFGGAGRAPVTSIRGPREIYQPQRSSRKTLRAMPSRSNRPHRSDEHHRLLSSVSRKRPPPAASLPIIALRIGFSNSNTVVLPPPAVVMGRICP